MHRTYRTGYQNKAVTEIGAFRFISPVCQPPSFFLPISRIDLPIACSQWTMVHISRLCCVTCYQALRRRGQPHHLHLHHQLRQSRLSKKLSFCCHETWKRSINCRTTVLVVWKLYEAQLRQTRAACASTGISKTKAPPKIVDIWWNGRRTKVMKGKYAALETSIHGLHFANIGLWNTVSTPWKVKKNHWRPKIHCKCCVQDLQIYEENRSKERNSDRWSYICRSSCCRGHKQAS